MMQGTCDAEGGEPPCWAHLLEDAAGAGSREPASLVDVADLTELSAATIPGVAWSQQSADLNVNLVVFGAGQGVAAHVNTEVDVLVVVLTGEGTLVIDDVHRPIRAGQALVIPKGVSRTLRGSGQGIAYLTCHHRRTGLWPSPRVAPSPPPVG